MSDHEIRTLLRKAKEQRKKIKRIRGAIKRVGTRKKME